MNKRPKGVSESDERTSLENLKGGDLRKEGEVQNALGLSEQAQGNHRKAEHGFLEAIKIWQEIREPIEEAKTWNSLGWTHQAQQQWSKAEECYRMALRICIENHDKNERLRSEQNLANLEEASFPFQSDIAAYERDDKAQVLWDLQQSDNGQDEITGSEGANNNKGQRLTKVDNKRPSPRNGGVLFYGSSSIRLWPLLQYKFPRYPVLNRGFGGARLSDCVEGFPRLVKPYSPRVIILYGGDNDLADGKDPEDILHSMEKFIQLVTDHLESAKVAFISIKPSPAHLPNRGKIEEANRLIKALAAKKNNFTFLDVYDEMLGSKEELYLDDGLHMSSEGYVIWKKVVEEYLSSEWEQQPLPERKAGSSEVKRAPDMWYSHNLGREMEMLVLGRKNAEERMLVFPTWRGDAHQYEENGMVDALRNYLESGRLQLFCIDGYDKYSLYNKDISPRERILNHLKFEKYILKEVLPFSESLNPDSKLITHGCSLGGYHALNIVFRNPGLFDGVIALSGRYDLSNSYAGFKGLFDGYYDDDIYFNTPSHYLPSLTDPELLAQIRELGNKDVGIKLAVGESDAFVENNRYMSTILKDKGIKHEFRVWRGVAHDFDHWRKMIIDYV